jgi:hypothetical protein
MSTTKASAAASDVPIVRFRPDNTVFLQKRPSTSSLLKVLEIERANKGKKTLELRLSES